MEDVLEVYTRPYDARFPQVCMDESSKQLLTEVRAPLPPQPATAEHRGTPAREDHEYAREGTANLFLACEPLRGWRHVAVTARRTAVDWAHFIRDVVDVQYPDAERIVLVLDNLNTHRPASLYEAFAPAEARRLLEQLEIHYTPNVHGDVELTHLRQDNMTLLFQAVRTWRVLSSLVDAERRGRQAGSRGVKLTWRSLGQISLALTPNTGAGWTWRKSN